MSKHTREEGEISFDGDSIVADAIVKLRNSARLDARQRVDAERAVRRMIELKLQAVGAGESQLKQIRIEFAGCRSTLTTIGETVGSKTWGVVESIIGRLIARAMENVIG